MPVRRLPLHHLKKANHAKAWDAELLAYVLLRRDTVAGLPGNTSNRFGAFVGREVKVANAAQVHYDTRLRGNLPAEADGVVIPKLNYKSGKGELKKLEAESNAAPRAELLVSIEGIVTDVPMTFKKNHFEYKLTAGVSLVGRLLTVTSSHGGSASVILE